MTGTVGAEFTTLDIRAIHSTLREMTSLRNAMLKAQNNVDAMQLHPTYVESAKNLLSYLALRRHDIRSLQHRLTKLGLSSLGRSEANILVSVDRVIEVLLKLSPEHDGTREERRVGPDQGEEILVSHTDALFGADAPRRGVRIMVTMPSEAAADYRLVKVLSDAGMDCQRINCAHDEPHDWLKMIGHARQAAQESTRPCTIMMDLAGPKLRTGALTWGPAVVRIRPSRDGFGRVTAPAKAWLHMDAQPRSDEIPAIQVPGKWLAQLKIDDVVKFRDARESKRRMRVVEVKATGCWVELEKTAYLIPGITLRLGKRSGIENTTRVVSVSVSEEQSINVREGDHLILARSTEPGHPPVTDKNGRVTEPGMIGCTLGDAFNGIQKGDPIWFDDGKIGGRVQSLASESLDILIDHAPGGAKLKSDKGINLPLSDLELDALSADDIQALEFACKHADVVQMSFVNKPRDIEDLVNHLTRLDALHMGVVLKIETKRAFEHLPELLLAGMRLPRLGVMIARGDLAIENGFERTAELQEEILCLCEAAHVPVIWATQVLETLAKTGSPSRAEITDAAMAGRAECVMLNKGPHIRKAIQTLDDVLGRMQTHRCKNISLLRELRVAHSPGLEKLSHERSASAS